MLHLEGAVHYVQMALHIVQNQNILKSFEMDVSYCAIDQSSVKREKNTRKVSNKTKKMIK